MRTASLRSMIVRVVSLFRKDERAEKELDAELRAHLQMHTEDNVRAGMPPEEARRKALLALGGVEQTKERVRDQRSFSVFESLVQDTRFALRLLRKSPGFTATCVITLAVGIGATTAIFSLLDQAILRPLPVKEPQRLVLLRHIGRDPGASYTRTDAALCFSYPMYQDLRDKNAVFSGLIATFWAQVGVEWHNGASEIVDAELVSGNYFEVLGLQPALGRLLVASDDLAPDANPAAVLSFDYWQRRFGSDTHIVNQSIRINGLPYTVLGVTRPGFHSAVSGDAPAVFVPMSMKAQITPGWNDLDERRSTWLNILGRLNPGLKRAEAEAGADALWHALRASELPAMGHSSKSFIDAFLTKSHLFLDDGSRGVPAHGTFRSELMMVMALAGLLILMACTNIGTLLLVRAAARSREISVRFALGASRNRVIRQLLAEGLILGLAGGTAGILLAPQISSVLIRKIWAPLRLGDLAFSSDLDSRVLFFNFFLAIVVSLLFSLAPIHQFWRHDLTPALKLPYASAAGGPPRLRRILVVAQISLSLLLLIGAGLLVRTLVNLKSVDVGFATDHLVTFAINPRLAGYEPERAEQLYHQVLETLPELPGVRSVAGTNDPELANNNYRANITVAGYRPAENENMNVEWSQVTPGFFATLKTPLLAGRDLSEQDRRGSAKVAVVSESFARRFFGDPRRAVGGFFCSGAGDVTPDIQIVGVAADIRHTDLREEMRPTVFVPIFQLPPNGRISFGMFFYLRTWQAPQYAEADIRQSIHKLDSSLVLDEFRTMQEQIDTSLVNERVVAFLALCFGLLAAFMAAIGIYGVLSYATAQRTREFGIRIALGASAGGVVRIVAAEVLWLAGIGIALGVPIALLFARAVRSQLFGVSSGDPLTVILGVSVHLCSCVSSCGVAGAAGFARGSGHRAAL